MAFRRTTGFVESLLRLVGLDRAGPDVSTLSRRQKVFAVNIPCRRARGLLYLLIDSTGSRAKGEGEWHARKHGGPKRRVWRRVPPELTSKRWRSGPPRSPQAISATRRSCLICSAGSRRTSRLAASPQMVPRIPENAIMPSRSACCHPAAQDREAMEDRHRRRNRPQRSAAGIQIPRARLVATMERLSPPEPRRNGNALSETPGPTPHGAELRSPGR